MNYELAKKLKDVGFPQDRKECEYLCDTCSNIGGEDDCVIPTFSELIEALGDKIYGFHRFKDGWCAEGTAIDLSTDEETSKGWCNREEPFGEGKTPLEAVANLYIALNDRPDRTKD